MRTEDRYTWADVLYLLGIPYREGKRDVAISCPRCNKKYYYAQMETGKGFCHKCKKGSNLLVYYAETRNIDTKEANKEILQSLGRWTPGKEEEASYTPKKFVPKKTQVFEKQSPLAPIEVRDATYRAMLSVMHLTDKHHQDLRKRGLTDQEIKDFGYVSFSKDQCESIATQLQAKGCTLQGVPGFYLMDGKWMLRELKNGILFRYKDENGFIQGFQLRKDDELLKSWYKNGKLKKERKCNWLASTDLYMGTSAEGFYHIVGDISGETLYLTEGGMKGDIIHAISGFPVVAIPGVGTLRKLEELFQSGYLQSKGVKEIVNAEDMDYLTNPDVFDSVEKMEKLIKKYDFRYRRLTWDDTYKGYDDYLAHYLRGV